MATALITGATSGIGHAMALALGRAGYDVYAVGRSEAALGRLQTAVPGVTTLALDITDRAAVATAVAELPIDVLVNNAGTMPPLGAFAETAVADIDATLATNLTAALLLTRLVVPRMRARQAGHIVFTGSTAAHAPSPNMAVYAAGKAALASFAGSLRAELSPLGIRVTELVLGRVETPIYKDVLGPEARAAMYAGLVAVQPEDVAAMLLALLALPASAAVTRLDMLPTRPVSPIPLNAGDRSR